MKKVTKKELIWFIILYVFALLIFLPFVTGHYATDTYNIINRGYHEYAIQYSLNDGRPIMCIISLIADFLKLPIQVYVISLTIIALFFSCLTVMLLRNSILKRKQPSNLVWETLIMIICYCTIFHFAFLENMQFAECAVMALSILMYTIAAQKMVEEQKYLLSGFLILVAILCYQGTVGWCITITFLYSLLEYKSINKQTIKNIAIAIIFCLFSIGINLLQIRISGNLLGMYQNRIGSIKNIQNNFKIIQKLIFPILKNSFNLFPPNLYLILVSGILITIATSIQTKREDKNFLILIVLYVVTVLITFAPHVITRVAIGTGRMAFSLGASIGVLLIYVYTNTDIFQKKGIQQKIMILITLAYFLILIWNYVTIMLEHKKVNLIDKENCDTIGTWMDEYEQKSQIKLENLVVVYDNESENTSYEVKNKSALCYRALYCSWSHVGVINYYTNRHLKWIENVQNEYTRLLQNQNWTKLEREQFLFVGNTVYYCVY